MKNKRKKVAAQSSSVQRMVRPLCLDRKSVMHCSVIKGEATLRVVGAAAEQVRQWMLTGEC